jgi:hypothetical protein
LRLAGAFLAALLFVAFLAGGTVTTFQGELSLGEVRTSLVIRYARECSLTSYAFRNLAPGP